MFWEAIKNGLLVWTYWETYIAFALYMAIFLIPTKIIDRFMTERNLLIELLFPMLIQVAHTFAVLVFIFSLSPIILGISDDAAWSYFWLIIINEPLIIGVLIVVGFVLVFIPVVRDNGSLYVTILGALTLLKICIISNYLSIDLSIKVSEINFFGPLFHIIILLAGLMIAGNVLRYKAMIFIIDYLAKYNNKILDKLYLLFLLISNPIATAISFIPLFIYGAWFGQTL